MPAVLNAANEEAVGAFLAGACSFTGITDTLARVLDAADGVDGRSGYRGGRAGRPGMGPRPRP